MVAQQQLLLLVFLFFGLLLLDGGAVIGTFDCLLIIYSFLSIFFTYYNFNKLFKKNIHIYDTNVNSFFIKNYN